jgi:hypothetical protein
MECKDVIDELTHSPVAPTNPGPLLSPDINTARLVVVGGRDAVQQSLLIDVGALLTILFEVKLHRSIADGYRTAARAV